MDNDPHLAFGGRVGRSDMAHTAASLDWTKIVSHWLQERP